MTGRAMRLRVGAGAIGAAAMFVLQVEGFGYLAGGVAGALTMFAIPLAGLGLVVLGLARERHGMLQTGVAISLAAAAAFAASHLVLRLQEVGSRERGDRLASTLQQWRRAHGRYPESLGALVPHLLQVVPPSCMSLFRTIPFAYSPLSDGADYRLAFPLPAFQVCVRGADGHWVTDD